MFAATIYGAGDLRLAEWPVAKLAAGDVRVRFARGGICGSDLSYYRKGGVGDFKLKEPMVLGHEVSGEIAEVGVGETRLKVGDRVAVNPSRPCLVCRNCRDGRSNLCLNMRFFGSAAIFPHVGGAFSETFTCRGDQCVAIPDDMSFEMAALAEPLSVALHGVRRAGDLLGKRVLIAGAGPIGQLLLLAARLAGASFIAITDIATAPLTVARTFGADEVIDVGVDSAALGMFTADDARFDVAIEATGVAPVLAQLFDVVRPGGRIVQLGMMPAGTVATPINRLMAREIDLVGAFRFSSEFAMAVDVLARRLIDAVPLVTASLPMSRLKEAFDLAGDRTAALKVQLRFD